MRLPALEKNVDPGRTGSMFGPPSGQQDASPAMARAEEAETYSEGPPAPAPAPVTQTIVSHRGAGALPPPCHARSQGQLTPSGSLRLEATPPGLDSQAEEPAPLHTAAPSPAHPPPGPGALHGSVEQFVPLEIDQRIPAIRDRLLEIEHHVVEQSKIIDVQNASSPERLRKLQMPQRHCASRLLEPVCCAQELCPRLRTLQVACCAPVVLELAMEVAVVAVAVQASE